MVFLKEKKTVNKNKQNHNIQHDIIKRKQTHHVFIQVKCNKFVPSKNNVGIMSDEKVLQYHNQRHDNTETGRLLNL